MKRQGVRLLSLKSRDVLEFTSKTFILTELCMHCFIYSQYHLIYQYTRHTFDTEVTHF